MASSSGLTQKKGYGFIIHPEGGADIFVHYSQIISERRFKTLRTGQVVEFELHEGPKGFMPVTSCRSTRRSGRQPRANAPPGSNSPIR
ncbi:cold shock domain-containing protein [Rhodothermus marinus]|uniref:cold shock domain-containing protein n=1 Tax=Rhodothermus marinus TaxID=29549 RepID=UPI000AD6AED0